MIYSGFRSVSLSFRHSLELKSPCGTPPSVVAPEVKNASRLLPAARPPMQRGGIFLFSGRLYGNSEGGIKQVIPAPPMPQKLEGCKQKQPRI